MPRDNAFGRTSAVNLSFGLFIYFRPIFHSECTETVWRSGSALPKPFSWLQGVGPWKCKGWKIETGSRISIWQINFITSWAVDIRRTAYYIHGPWGDEFNFFAVSLNDGPYTLLYTAVLHFIWEYDQDWAPGGFNNSTSNSIRDMLKAI